MLFNRDERLPQTWLSVAHGINDIYSGFLNPIMPFIAAQVGISMAASTVILSVAHICSSILQPIFGYFADKMRSRALLFWGLIMTSVFVPLAAASTEIPWLVIFIILGSLGSSFFHPQALGLISTFTTSSIVKNMGVFMALGTLGFSLGPLLAGFIAQYIGLDQMPWISLVGVIFALLMFPMVPSKGITQIKKPSFLLRDAVRDIFSHRQLVILNIISMLKSLITNSTTILLPFLWKNIGYTQAQIGMALFFFILMGAVASFTSSKLEAKIGTHNVFYFSMIGTAPLMVVFYFTYESLPVVSFIVFTVMGFVTAFASPITMSLAQSKLPQYKSVIGGFINGFSWGIIAICMTLVAFIAQHTDIATVLLTVAFIPALCSPLVRYLHVNH